jgi:hypothetical protein
MSDAIHPVEPTRGGETTNSVVGGGFNIRVGMVSIGSMLLNPIWIIGASTLVFSIVPMVHPRSHLGHLPRLG